MLVLVLFSVTVCDAQLQRFIFTQPKMGSPLNIIFFTNDETGAKAAADACFALADSLNDIFSDYLVNSEINRLSATAGKDTIFKPSLPLMEILKQSKDAWRTSDHAFDITLGSISMIWRASRKDGKFPSKESILTAVKHSGAQHLIIQKNGVSINLEGIKLDLGGIAKGYVAQQLINLLQTKNIKMALVDAGGDIVCSGSPPNANGWKIGIGTDSTQTQKQVSIFNKAIATSGDLYQFVEHNGKRYSHIIDPATGYGITKQRKVTVIANDGATADWLASACSILSHNKSKRLIKKYNAALYIETQKRGRVKTTYTNNMKWYLSK